MKQYIITTLCILYAIVANCQNNAIFTGGNGDGWASNNHQQLESNIFTGGNGDGWAGNNYQQPENNIFAGGIGDGWAKDTAKYKFEPPSVIIEHPFGSNFSVYPNPTEGNIEITLGANAEKLNAEMYDAGGSLIYKQHAENTNCIKLQITGAAGVYFIKVYSGKGAATVKVVKQ